MTGMNLIWILFSLQGRINRTRFWVSIICMSAITFIPIYTLFNNNKEAGDLYASFMMLALAWPAVTVQAKRWHDRDKSAHWIFINFIPIIGLWAIIENGFLAGTEGRNRFDVKN